MKKKLVTLLILSALMISAGCTPKYQDDKEPSGTEEQSGYITVEPKEIKPLGDTLIERKFVSDIPVPEGGVSLEKALESLYSCNREELYLPESANTYSAVCLGIVDYNNKDYYSIYLTLDTGKEKILVGTHYLVSTTGKTVRKKTWTGEHYTVKKGSASSDQTVAERFPDAKLTPNDALKKLAEKKDALKLEKPFSEYIFEMNEELEEINGTPCYSFVPKLEYTDHTSFLNGFYVSLDGSMIWLSDPDSSGKYIEIK